MKFTLTIESDGEALVFLDGQDKPWAVNTIELRRLLTKATNDAVGGDATGDSGSLIDANGNTVGAWTLEVGA